MTEMIQEFYRYILTPFARLSRKFTEESRNLIIFLCTLLISVYFVIRVLQINCPLLKESLSRAHFICCIILFILIVFSIGKPLGIIKWNRFLYYSMVLAGAGMLFISLLHKVGDGYRAFSLILMFVFPALYYAWNNRRDYDTLFKMFSASLIISGFFIFILFIIHACKGTLIIQDGRFAPNMNVNSFGAFGVIMIVCALYLIYLKGSSHSWLALCILSLSTGIDIILVSESRTSALVAVGAAICYLIFANKKKRLCASSHSFNAKAVFISVTCLFLLTVLLYSSSEMLIRIDAEKKAQAASPVVSTESSSSEAAASDAPEEESLADRFDTKDETLDSFSSGRTALWKWYYSHINFWTGTDIDPGMWAHNAFLEFAYRFGIPVALIHIAMELYAGILALKILFSKRMTEPYYLFVSICIMMYAIESMLEFATLPFDAPYPFLYYLALMPMFEMSFKSTAFSDRYPC